MCLMLMFHDDPLSCPKLTLVKDHPCHVEARVRVNDFASYRRAEIAGQKHGHATDLTGFDGAPQWRFGRGFCQQFVEVLNAGCRSRTNRTG
jgi:hypothetical protein